LAAFLMLTVFAPAASVSFFRSPSFLNDASHRAAARGFLPVPLQDVKRGLDYRRRPLRSPQQRTPPHPHQRLQETSYKPVVTTKTKTHRQEDEKNTTKNEKTLKNFRGGYGVAGAGHVDYAGRRFEYDHERSYGKHACPI
jgi:hypothetical protein